MSKLRITHTACGAGSTISYRFLEHPGNWVVPYEENMVLDCKFASYTLTSHVNNMTDLLSLQRAKNYCLRYIFDLRIDEFR